MAVGPVGNVASTLAAVAVRRAGLDALSQLEGVRLDDLVDALAGAAATRRAGAGLGTELAQAAAGLMAGARGLAERARELTNPAGNAFDLRAVTSDNPGRVTGTAAPGAREAEFEVEVEQLAEGQRNVGQRLDPRAATNVQAGANTFAIDIGGETRFVTFNVRAGQNNQTVLESMANAINQANPGVTADVRTAEDGRVRIRITQNDTGQEATFAIRDVQGNAVATTGANRVGNQAANAVYSIDGQQFEGATNTVQLDEGRVQLQLDRVTEGAVTVRVGADVEGQAAAIQGFVNEFNDQRRFLNQNAAFFNTDAANALDTVVGANRADLQRIGITQAADGTLRVDEDRLRAALAENPGQVREVFNGFDGLARGVERFAERVTTTSPRGFTAGSAVERLLAGGASNFNAAGALAGTQFGAALALGLLFDQYF